MTWDGVVHMMEEIGFPRECWGTAELLWNTGDFETLLHMLNIHALDPYESNCRPIPACLFRTALPAAPHPWALQAAERLIAGTRNCPRKMLAWIVARHLEVEFENRERDQAREAGRNLLDPPFPPE